MNFTPSCQRNTQNNASLPDDTAPHQEFPYTAYYLSQKLHVSENHIIRVANLLGVRAHQDLETGHLFFSATDVTRIRQALEKEARGERIQPILGRQAIPPKANEHAGQPVDTTQQTIQKPYATQQPIAQAQHNALVTTTDVSVLADAVNSMRSQLLGEVSNVLENKLSGLDEMVIELVRAKTTIATLQKQLQDTHNELIFTRAELNSYRPAAFGLYKKIR